MMIIIIKTLQTLAGVKVSASAAGVRFGLARKRGARGQSPGQPHQCSTTLASPLCLCLAFLSLQPHPIFRRGFGRGHRKKQERSSQRSR